MGIEVRQKHYGTQTRKRPLVRGAHRPILFYKTSLHFECEGACDGSFSGCQGLSGHELPARRDREGRLQVLVEEVVDPQLRTQG